MSSPLLELADDATLVLWNIHFSILTDRKRHPSWHSVNRRDSSSNLKQCFSLWSQVASWNSFAVHWSAKYSKGALCRSPGFFLSLWCFLLSCSILWYLCVLVLSESQLHRLSSERLTDSPSACSPWVTTWMLSHNREMAPLQRLHHLFPVYQDHFPQCLKFPLSLKMLFNVFCLFWFG